MEAPRPPKRTTAKPPKQSLMEILTNQLELLSITSAERLFDRDERALLEVVVKCGVMLSESDLEKPKEASKKLSARELMAIVESSK